MEENTINQNGDVSTNQIPPVIPTTITPPIVPEPQVATQPVLTPVQTAPTNGGTKKTLFIVAGVIIIIIIVVVMLTAQGKKKDDGPTSFPKIGKILSTPTPSKEDIVKAVDAKYEQDTDLDSIPDIVEKEIGLNSVASDFDRCKAASCGDTSKSTAGEVKNNILLIIDSSGSMGLKFGEKVKMDMAKESIRRFMSQTVSNVTVGIMVYGEKGSNSEGAKAISCASTELVAPIGSVNSSTVDSYLSKINPTGWTPIGLAIRNGISAFAGKEGQKNQMIIVTDGAETCGTNPETAATDAKNSAYKIKVDVIGFAVSASEQAALKTVSSNGGGLFSLAMNSDELTEKFKASRENWDKQQSGAKCIIDVYSTSVNCLQSVKKSVDSYFVTADKASKGYERGELMIIGQRISKAYNDKISATQSEQRTKISELNKILLNQ